VLTNDSAGLERRAGVRNTRVPALVVISGAGE
jgi:hypothetical protein